MMSMLGFDAIGQQRRCIPERRETLLIQQAQLIAGKRDAQMFPAGTAELPLPDGFERHENSSGAFHFRPDKISTSQIERLISVGRENEILNLGPFNKADVAERVLLGEQLVCLVERSPDDVEIRSAAGTESTLPAQIEYFAATMEANSRLELQGLVETLNERLMGAA